MKESVSFRGVAGDRIGANEEKSPYVPLMFNLRQTRPKEQTVMVIGQPRGGTSVVSATLDAIGVYIGEPGDLHRGGTFENQVLCHGTSEEQDAEVARCNAQHSVWGWKNPHGVMAFKKAPTGLRNLCCIIVFRDLASLTMSYCKHTRSDLKQSEREQASLIFARQQLEALALHALTETSYPTLVVSYERILVSPEPFIESLAAFLGITITTEQGLSAMCRIQPGGGYLKTQTKEKCDV